jgi:hypothetical protein
MMHDAIKNHLKYYCKENEISDAGVRVGELLDRWGGLHHFDPAALKKVDWSNPRFVVLKISKYHTPANIATYDFSDLTNLVFLAHDLCIRVAISPCNPQYLELMLHPRQREGSASQRHPTIEQALQAWREQNPAPNQVSTEGAPR